MIKQQEHCSNIGKSEIVTDLQAGCGAKLSYEHLAWLTPSAR